MSPEKRIQLMQQIVPLVNLHRRFGLAAFIIIIVICVTGILLNHTEEFALKDRFIESHWLKSWYGIEVEGEASIYPVVINQAQYHVASLEEHLYVNNQLISQNAGMIVGAVTAADLIIVSTPTDLFLVTPQAELIEKMSLSSFIASDIEKIGVGASGLVLLSSAENVYTSRDDFLSWQPFDTQVDDAQWSEAASVSTLELEELKSHHLAKSIDWERLVLDLHSGRIFGQWGVWLYDITALVIIFLSISGCWAWYKKRQLKKLK